MINNENDIKVEKQYYVDIAPEIVSDLQLYNNDDGYTRVDNGRVIVQFDKDIKPSMIKTTWILIPTIVSTIIFILFNLAKGNTQVMLTGPVSIARLVNFIGLASGTISFVYFFIKLKTNGRNINVKDIYWRNFASIVVSFAIIILLSSVLFFKILNTIFYGASFDLYTSSLMFFIFSGMINYAMIFLAYSITPRLLTDVLIFVIIGGVFVAMITNSQEQWWHYNFSFLGTSYASNSWGFNLTLIVS
ncbi:MAG: hypothetical protein ACRCTA_00775 [Bacilli bacterium]